MPLAKVKGVQEIMENLVQNFVPAFIRVKLNDRLSRKQEAARLKTIANDILHYYSALPSSAIPEEVREIVSYIERKGACVFPYPFQEKYKPEDIEVCLDRGNGLRFVNQDGKRLYFRRDWSEKRIQVSYSCLAMEQDPLSPHRYLINSFQVNKGDTFVDVGAAEGNLSLSVIEDAKLAYLFEADDQWIEPLKATFKPWQSKVHIINKYVSDRCDDNSISLDSFFSDKAPFDCIKIDVEGYERQLLNGCKQRLDTSSELKIAICTYHKQDDEIDFGKLLLEKGFQVQASQGYMLFLYGESPRPPYFRRGLIRASRQVTSSD